MRTPVESAAIRLAAIHHQFYPHLSAEDFYTHIQADLLHFNNTLNSMGLTNSAILGLKNEAVRLYVLDNKTSHTQRKLECQPSSLSH